MGIVLFAGVGLLGAPAVAEITSEDLGAHVTYLADDAREGRGPGTDGLDAAGDYIEGVFEAIGLKPLFAGGYTQEFEDGQARILRNVGGMIEGRPGEQHLVIAAHYDHLGMEPGDPPTIFNGADDNASGVAALIELAVAFADREDPPGRSLVFIAFSGEEQELLGSRRYLMSPDLPLSSTAAMINLDTIGRLRDDRLLVFGTGTAPEFAGMLEGVNYVFRLDLAVSPEPHSAGDHAPFFEKGIPVLHFFTDGHPDYHRATDTVDRVNLEGLTTVTEFVAEVIDYLSDDSVTLSFVPVGAEKVASRAAPEAKRRRVSFGTIPDFSRESGGILVTGLIPGSPAEKAGITVGDLIVEIDGQGVENLYDYQGVLENKEPGDEMTVVFVRDDERKTVTATLVKRR